jgi:Ca2+-binding EF-hand superfamily protein
MKFTAIAAALGFAATAALAAQDTAPPQASGQGQGVAARFKKADTNGDGMLSRDEARALPQISRHFDEIDANHDGQVTSDEIRAYHAKMRAQRQEVSAARFKKIDTDGDGKISRAEAQANSPRLAEHFDEIDTNKDGFITPEEMKAAQLRRQQASSK